MSGNSDKNYYKDKDTNWKEERDCYICAADLVQLSHYLEVYNNKEVLLVNGEKTRKEERE